MFPYLDYLYDKVTIFICFSEVVVALTKKKTRQTKRNRIKILAGKVNKIESALQMTVCDSLGKFCDQFFVIDKFRSSSH